MSGTILFKPLEGKLTHDTDTFAKMDPYVQILIGNAKHKGKVCSGGGKTPKWNETIVAHRNYEAVAYLEVKDDDVFKDDVIGVGQIDLNQVVPNSSTAKWYPIFFKQKPAGEILMEIVFTPDSNAQTSSNPISNVTHAHHKNHF